MATYFARIAIIALVIVMTVVPVASCKEGDQLVSVSSARAEFDADPVPPTVTERYVTLVPSEIDGGRITLDIVLHEIDEPIVGVALKVSYDAGFARFIDCQDGELFPAGNCLFSEPTPNSGVVFISRSVTGIGQATTVSGAQVIARLRFLVFGLDEALVTFDGQNLGGGDASAVLDLDGQPIFMNWYTGVLRGE